MVDGAGCCLFYFGSVQGAPTKANLRVCWDIDDIAFSTFNWEIRHWVRLASTQRNAGLAASSVRMVVAPVIATSVLGSSSVLRMPMVQKACSNL